VNGGHPSSGQLAGAAVVVVVGSAVVVVVLDSQLSVSGIQMSPHGV
jgi:hypothetical protein